MRYARVALLWAALGALVFFVSSAGGAAGDLDLAFDGDGKVTTDIGGEEDRAYGVALQGDGKIVAAGYCTSAGGGNTDFCLARYNPDGSLDASFDGDGKVTTTFGTSGGSGYAMALQGDGKIVAAGACYTGVTHDFCLARYNPDGSLDTSFDGDGKVTTAIGESTDEALAVAVQGNGKIVAAGYCDNGANDDFCLARYNPGGSLDTSFSADGKVTTAIGAGDDFAYAVALQGDGKIVAAGPCVIGSTYRFCLARYNLGGNLDTSFSADGKVTAAIGAGDDLAYAMALQGDGKIVAAGYCIAGSAFGEFCLARYNPDGSLDSSFDGDGGVTTAIGGFGDYVLAVALQADRKIVAAGSCSDGSVPYRLCLARYNPDGSLDTGFSGDGKVTTAIGTYIGDWAEAVVIQTDAKIVAAGFCHMATGYSDFCLARYEADVDGDGITEGTDNDDDGDGHWDTDETAKGSVVLDPGSTPEHCDAVDNDGDTVLDETPALSGRVTPDPLCGPGADPDGDTILNAADPDDDGDGFTDANEQYMSTDELDDCRVGAGHDAWPPDANADGDADVGDVIVSFGGGKVLQDVGDPFYSRRSDATGNGQVNVGDVIALFGGGIILTSC